MVEFLLERAFDLEAKNNVRLHLSYVACFLLLNSSVTRAISVLQQASTYWSTMLAYYFQYFPRVYNCA